MNNSKLRLSISTKIVLGNSISLVVLMIALLVITIEFGRVQTATKTQADAMEAKQRIVSANLKYGELEHDFSEFARTWGDQPLDKANAAAAELAELLRHIDVDDGKKNLELIRSIEQFRNLMIQSVDDVIAGDRLGSNQVAIQAEQIGREIQDQLNRASNSSESVLQNSLAAATTASHRMRTVIFLAIGITFLVTILASGLIGRWMGRRVRAVSDMLHEISEGDGDLTKRLDVKSNDEIRDLAQNFNRFADRIQNLVIEVQSRAADVASAANELSSTANELSRGADETNHVSNSAQDVSNAMGQNMGQIRDATQAVNQEVTQVAEAIDELNRSFDGVAEQTQHALSVAHEAKRLARGSSEKVNILSDSATAITDIVGLIREIADQTNLLSLNATIEAARAGDAGKGFAVVASEIKQLAGQVTNATNEISERSSGIREYSHEAIAAIDSIQSVIDEVNSASENISAVVNQQRSTVGIIDKDILRSQEITKDMSRHSVEAHQSSERLSQSIVVVHQAAASTAAGAEQTKTLGTSLNQTATLLQGCVSQFTVA